MTMPNNNTLPPPDYLGGLDLGQMADFTALALLERAVTLGEKGEPVNHYAVRHLHRWPLRTPYPAIVADVVKLYAAPPLANSALVVDRTGVGVAVFDLLRAAAPKAWLNAAMITGGSQAGYTEDGSLSVPKRDLAGVLQVLLGTRRLQVAPTLPLAQVLASELGTFKVKININTGNESFEAWRERDHDDLVLAAALACWHGERHALFQRPKPIPNPPRRNPFADDYDRRESAQERLRARFERRGGRYR
jgi:hypothetical protein